MLVWLASYPKSGNTWLRAILTALEVGPNGKLDINRLEGGGSSRYPGEFEEITGLRWADLPDAERMELLPEYVVELARIAEGWDFRKSHEKYILSPCGRPIYTGEAGARAIYIVRDPRDVAISYAAHGGISIDQIICGMAWPNAKSGRSGGDVVETAGTWSEHVSGWLGQDNIPVYLIRYEDLIEDPVPAVSALLEFVERRCETYAIEQALAATRFDKLRQMEKEQGFAERSAHSETFFREGKAGNWQNVLTEEQTSRIERDHARVMRSLGYLPLYDTATGAI